MKQNVEDLRKLYEELDYELFDTFDIIRSARSEAMGNLYKNQVDIYNEDRRILENCRLCEIVTEFGYNIIDNNLKGNDIITSASHAFTVLLIVKMDETMVSGECKTNLNLLECSERILHCIDQIALCNNKDFNYTRKTFFELN